MEHEGAEDTVVPCLAILGAVFGVGVAIGFYKVIVALDIQAGATPQLLSFLGITFFLVFIGPFVVIIAKKFCVDSHQQINSLNSFWKKRKDFQTVFGGQISDFRLGAHRLKLSEPTAYHVVSLLKLPSGIPPTKHPKYLSSVTQC